MHLHEFVGAVRKAEAGDVDCFSLRAIFALLRDEGEVIEADEETVQTLQSASGCIHQK